MKQRFTRLIQSIRVCD